MLGLYLAAPDKTALAVLGAYLRRYDARRFNHRMRRLAIGTTLVKIPDGQAALQLWDLVRTHGTKDQIRQLKEFIESHDLEIPKQPLRASSPIDEVGLDVSTHNALLRGSIDTAGKLMEASEHALRACLGRGKRLHHVLELRSQLNLEE